MFRFKLRTLLLVVAVIATVLGWLTSEARIVAKRNDIRRRLDAKLDGVFCKPLPDEKFPALERFIEGDKSRRVSWVRRWMGDDNKWPATLFGGDVPNYAREVVEAFPECDIYFPNFAETETEWQKKNL